MTRPEYLEWNPVAVEQQTIALSYSLHGNQEAARTGYENALDTLERDLLIAPDSADRTAQRGAIGRDLGFTYVRDGVQFTADANRAEDTEAELRANAEDDFQTAFRTIQTAIGETALYTSGAQEPNFQKPLSELPNHTYKKPRRELFSAHAASLGLLARAATAAEVTLNMSTEQTRSLRGNYGFAHDFARLGTNGYFRTSNAMNGARDEIIAGRKIHAGVWVARAAFSIAWSIKNDRGNVGDAARTFLGRLGDLRSQRAARASVGRRP